MTAQDQSGANTMTVPLPESRRGSYDTEYFADQLRAYGAACAAEERERCASLLHITRAEASLACGDMTAQEWRTVSAVLAWRQRVIKEQP